MMPANNAIIANLLPPAMANVVDKLQVAAGAIVFVHFHLMTAALMSAMNAISTAGSRFSWCWGQCLIGGRGGGGGWILVKSKQNHMQTRQSAEYKKTLDVKCMRVLCDRV